MSLLKIAGAAVVALGLTAGHASAADGECTDKALEDKQTALMEYIKANPDKADKVEAAAAEVEKDYGGEPPAAKRCEAMDKLLAKLKAT